MPLPDSFPVSVLMERRPGVTRWATEVWQAVGVTVGKGPDRDYPEVAVDQGTYLQLRYGSFSIRLHRDEAASYYHNLTSPAPGCYVIASNEEIPKPLMVTLNFDEANAYGEGDAIVFHVALPAELHQWLERYVIMYYEPEEKRKRKLKSSREQRGFDGTQ